MKYCGKCGAEIEKRARFCSSCGEPMKDCVASIRNKPLLKMKKTKSIVLWVVTVFLAILALANIKNLSGVLFFLSALFVVPVVEFRTLIKRYIPSKAVITLIPIVLFFVGCAAIPVSEVQEIEQSTPVISAEYVDTAMETPVPQVMGTYEEQGEETVDVNDEMTENESVVTVMDEPEATAVSEEGIPADSSFEIHFIDVGQADAALVLCDDAAMLVDGGNSEDSDLIYAYLEAHEISYLDYIVATHGHEDHVGGLSGALNHATVGTAYCSVTEYDSEAFEDFVRYLGEQDVCITVPSPGESFELGSADVTILGPIQDSDDPNNMSIVLRIVYGDTSFLFAGDAERQEEADILDAGYKLKSTVLKVGHHGSENATSYPFLYEVEPEYAVISVGEGNSYGHPTEDVLSRLRDADVTVYRTDIQGTVICESDGQQVTFTVERNADVNTLEAVTVTPKPEPMPTPEPSPEPTPVIEVDELSQTMYAETGVNVRSGPGTDYDVQGSLSTNDDVHVTGKTENGWYRIEYGGGVGYVSGSYLSYDKVVITPAPQTQSYSGGSVWIPRTGSKYHDNPNCSNMKNPSQVTESQAIAWGYEPCKKCY